MARLRTGLIFVIQKFPGGEFSKKHLKGVLIMFDTIHIFVPDFHQIVRISEGTGDNLLEEDVADGFVDYIYYETYDLGYDITEVDGGQIMLTEPFQDKYKSTEDCILDVLEMAYGEESLKYIVLK